MAVRSKVQISVDPELLGRVDRFAEDNYTSRSAVFAMGAAQLINQQLAVSALLDIAVTMKRIADEGKVDDEARRELDDFARLANVLAGKRERASGGS